MAPNLEALLESLLFVSDGPVAIRRLAQALETTDEEVKLAILGLAETCQGRGIRLLRHGDSLQLISAPEAGPYVERLLGLEQSSKLSSAALETLAIVAYQQPVTRATIESIRGVNSDRAISTLLARGLVCEVGRLESVGRPILLGTTFDFLQYFGIEDLTQLPPLERSEVS
ncbi:MAG: SMC-Scp complex subunit ScpB [Chloroflexi bacterium]|nr:SMC-Scp complex subunit ScpB [Chloroflexota bacterium]